LAPGQQLQHTSLPLSPVSLSSSHVQVPFIDESSHPLRNQQAYYAEPSSNGIQGEHPALIITSPPSPITPLSPIASGKPSTPRLESVLKSRRKRQTSDASTDEDGETSATESSTSVRRPLKRVNRHDTRCLTIHVRFPFHSHS
jgi:hypothetical protein